MRKREEGGSDRNARQRDALAANLFYMGRQPTGLDALLPSVAFIIAASVVWSSKHIYPVSFYEVSAQVIPVLMLALALELRAFELPTARVHFKAPRTIDEARKRAADPAQQELSDRIRGLIVLFALIGAELLSLRAIGYSAGGRTAQGFIVGAITASLVMIAIRVVFGQRGTDSS